MFTENISVVFVGYKIFQKNFSFVKNVRNASTQNNFNERSDFKILIKFCGTLTSVSSWNCSALSNWLPTCLLSAPEFTLQNQYCTCVDDSVIAECCWTYIWVFVCLQQRSKLVEDLDFAKIHSSWCRKWCRSDEEMRPFKWNVIISPCLFSDVTSFKNCSSDYNHPILIQMIATYIHESPFSFVIREKIRKQHKTLVMLI